MPTRGSMRSDLGDRKQRSIWHWLLRLIWLAIALIALVIVVALGIGLGVGLRKISPDNPSMSSISPPSNSTSTSNSSSLIFTRGVLNDTSLASVITFDGNRHIFLQDINGTLRHAVFSSTTNLWLPNVDYLWPHASIPTPRLGTPVVATYPSDVWGPTGISLFYVNANSILSAVTFDTYLGLISDSDEMEGTIAIKQDSRCVTAATVRRSANDGTRIAYTLLFIEAPSGHINFFHGQRT